MHIESDIKLDFCDVLLRPKRSEIESRNDVQLTRTFKFKYSPYEWTGVPIIAANMDGVGTLNMYDYLSQREWLTCGAKTINTEGYEYMAYPHRFGMYFIPSTGFDEVENLRYCHKYFNWICLDVPNGYLRKFERFVSKVREEFPNHVIIAGNVVSKEMTEALILAGADVVKAGIGGGAACTTRKITGVGVPQLASIMECADAAHGLGGHIISDGGCATPGDVVKAFAAGADFVMLGSMLAGHAEGGGERIEKDGKQYVEFYGMSSKKANEKHFGGLKDYRAAEGRIVQIPFKGSVVDTMQEIEGGLRSACTYVGASRIKDLPKCATFVQVNRQLNTLFERYES